MYYTINHMLINNTLLPYSELFNKAEKFSRRKKAQGIAFILFYAFYFLLLLMVLGFLLRDTQLHPVLASLLFVLAVGIPFVAFSVLYSKKNAHVRRCDTLVREFLDTNKVIVATERDFQYLEEFYRRKRTPEDFQRFIEQQGWQKSEKDVLQLAAMVTGIADVLSLPGDPEQEQHDIASGVMLMAAPTVSGQPREAFFFNHGSVPIILIGSSDHTDTEWVAIGLLSSSTRYASLYVDVSSNGKDIYFDPQNKVNMLQLAGSRYGVYAAVGGDADAYYMADKLGFAWLNDVELPFDFELMNNLLILRKPLRRRGLFKRNDIPDILFHPRTIQLICEEFETLLQRLGAEEHAAKDTRLILPFTRTWRQHISYSRARYFAGRASLGLVVLVIYYSVMSLLFLLALVATVVLIGAAGKGV